MTGEGRHNVVERDISISGGHKPTSFTMSSRDSPINKYIHDMKCANVLKEILPARCIDRLNSGAPSGFTWHHESIGVLFTDIVGFTSISAQYEMEFVVEMLNDMFTRFDNICEAMKVFKVETIGDSYMVVSGHSVSNPDPQCWRLFLTAVQMLDQCQEMAPNYPFPVKIRIGTHVGKASSGVIGRIRPRYGFFGDTINMASRMESSSEPGHIMLSEPFFKCIQRQLEINKFKVTCQNKMIKGKGPQECYLVRNSNEFAKKFTQDSNVSSKVQIRKENTI
jgi:class 3 adenylate cyclase